MKHALILFFLVIINYSDSFSQGIFTISTDKSKYSYGEIIEVKANIFNNTDTTIRLAYECLYAIRVTVKTNGIKIPEFGSTVSGCETLLKKGEKETWTFQIIPSKLGFPLSGGEQTIYVSGYHHKDSIKISAPKYYGGIIEVPFNYLLEQGKRDKLFNDLNATLIKRDSIKSAQQVKELWSIKGKSIDSLANALNDVQYLNWNIATYRRYENGIRTVTSINVQEPIPTKYILLNYPNPFNPCTTISYHLPKQSNVILRVCDLLGREVARLVNEVKSAGKYSIAFDGNDLSSGVYFYQLVTDEIILTKKFVLMK